MEKKGIFSALDLAKYLNWLHNQKKNCNISPLKLQKTLFFLFGEWGAFILKSQSNINGDWESLKDYSIYLFDDKIEAWLYGPVIKQVYDKFDNEKLSENEIFITPSKKYVGEFIKDLALELFELSDFRLVELTHQMKCWQDNFNKKAPSHNKEINKDIIINEFLLQV